MSGNRKLRIMTATMLRQIEARRNHAGITPNELKVLSALDGFDRPVGRREVADVIGYNPGSVDFKTTSSLSKASLIKKDDVGFNGDKYGFSMVMLEITKKGQEILSIILTGKVAA